MGHFNWHRPQAWEALKTFLSNLFPAIERGIAKQKTVKVCMKAATVGANGRLSAPVTFSVSDNIKPIKQIKSQTMQHPLMNLVNTILSQQYGDQ